MASTGAPTTADYQALKRTVQLQTIQKAILQSICSVNGLPKTGNKNELQKRILNLLESCEKNGETQRFYEIRESIYKATGLGPSAPGQPSGSYYAPISSQSTPQYAMAPSSYSSPSGSWSGNGGYRAPPPMSLSQQTFTYKPSPFYDIVARVGDVKTCEIMTQHRNTVTIQIRALDNPLLQQCGTDPALRVMIFCAAGNTGAQDIAFPQQSELKVNTGEIKANLRGLKNKPGSTRPVDITDSLRLKPPTYCNNVEFTYALTSKVSPQFQKKGQSAEKHYLGAYICKVTPVEGLVKQITKKIRKESVVAEIAKKASDPDVIATSQILSLKCPLTYMRLKLPCRALSCTHIQCFDATSYLQLQEQGPQWICPICNKSAPFDQLAVDEYVREILVETEDSVEQVTIETDAKWSAPGAPKSAKSDSSYQANYLDDDDFVIQEVYKSDGRSTATPSRAGPPSTMLGTPASGVSRDTPTTAPRSATSNKREVIDLTLSDDDEPPRPVKRANYGNSNGYSY